MRYEIVFIKRILSVSAFVKMKEKNSSERSKRADEFCEK